MVGSLASDVFNDKGFIIINEGRFWQIKRDNTEIRKPVHHQNKARATDDAIKPVEKRALKFRNAASLTRQKPTPHTCPISRNFSNSSKRYR
jgi:hypothetical protein